MATLSYPCISMWSAPRWRLEKLQ